MEKLTRLGEGRSQGWASWALLFCLLAHLVLSWVTHLSFDEAHYALYADHLALSYYDHPPLVGWLQWPAVALGGSDLLLRVMPMLCWLLTAVALWRFTGHISLSIRSPDPNPAAEGALLLFILGLMPHLLGFALVPDTLLMPLGMALMAQTWHLARPGFQHRHNPADTVAAGQTALIQPAALSDWLLLGLLLGLAGLSKYTAVLLLPGVVYTLTLAHGGRWLRQSGPWWACLLALGLVSPVFIWNAQHEWASFAYQLSHSSGSQNWQFRNFLNYGLAQILLYGLLPLLACVAGLSLLKRRGAFVVAHLCLSFALPGLLVTLFLSGRGAALPHWTIWAWVCLLPLAGLGWQAMRQKRPRLTVGLVMAQALICLAAAVGLLTATPATPFADLHGWDKAARQARQLAQERGLARLAVANWSLASRMAWYARPLPLIVVQSHHDQYDLWFGRFKAGDAALLVDWSIMPFAPPVRNEASKSSGFARCEPISRLATVVLGREVSHFDFLQCSDWQGQN